MAEYFGENRDLTPGERLVKLETRLSEAEKKIETINECLPKSFVSLSRYLPVERLFYGLAGGILIAVLGAIIYKVISVPGGVVK